MRLGSYNRRKRQYLLALLAWVVELRFVNVGNRNPSRRKHCIPKASTTEVYNQHSKYKYEQRLFKGVDHALTETPPSCDFSRPLLLPGLLLCL